MISQEKEFRSQIFFSFFLVYETQKQKNVFSRTARVTAKQSLQAGVPDYLTILLFYHFTHFYLAAGIGFYHGTHALRMCILKVVKVTMQLDVHKGGKCQPYSVLIIYIKEGFIKSF